MSTEPKKPTFRGRERAEPGEAQRRIPLWYLGFALCMTAWGTLYFFQDIGSPPSAGDLRTPIVIDPTAKVDGAAVFSGNCVACHQTTGVGLPGVFPPLAGSEWVQAANKEIPVQILLHGITGSIVVKGGNFSGAMPNFSKTLDDASIAAVLTHVRKTWGNTAGEITAADVAAGRKRFPDHEAPWAGGAEIESAVGKP